MDFNSITTPAELVEQNKTPEFNEDQERCIKLLDDVLSEGPKVGLVLTKIIIENLVDMHQVNVDDREDKNEVIAWQTDLIKLQMVNELLKDVEL